MDFINFECDLSWSSTEAAELLRSLGESVGSPGPADGPVIAGHFENPHSPGCTELRKVEDTLLHGKPGQISTLGGLSPVEFGLQPRRGYKIRCRHLTSQPNQPSTSQPYPSQPNPLIRRSSGTPGPLQRRRRRPSSTCTHPPEEGARKLASPLPRVSERTGRGEDEPHSPVRTLPTPILPSSSIPKEEGAGRPASPLHRIGERTGRGEDEPHSPVRTLPTPFLPLSSIPEEEGAGRPASPLHRVCERSGRGADEPHSPGRPPATPTPPGPSPASTPRTPRKRKCRSYHRAGRKNQLRKLWRSFVSSAESSGGGPPPLTFTAPLGTPSPPITAPSGPPPPTFAAPRGPPPAPPGPTQRPVPTKATAVPGPSRGLRVVSNIPYAGPRITRWVVRPIELSPVIYPEDIPAQDPRRAIYARRRAEALRR